jgi:hypothetical protein
VKRLLDLYCGIGGCTRGYQLAGFEVTGIDIREVPDYCGDNFIQGNAIEYLMEHYDEFDAFHASPPCQHDCNLTLGTNSYRAGSYEDLLPPTLNVLLEIDKPFIIEQPIGDAKHKMRIDMTLCGEMFGLGVIRHRWFMINGFDVPASAHKPHRGLVTMRNHGVNQVGPYFAVYGDGTDKGTNAQWREAMGIDWTWNRKELALAIPPAYTEYIGRYLI